ncbi:Ste3-like pheromone receptor, partial [Mycena amicta]
MGTIALVGWISLACLNGPLNSLIWMDNTEDHDWAPVFCVSSLLFTQAAMVGIPTAALAINRRFYLILRRARQQEISAPMPPSGDILICVLPPVLYLVLQGTSSFQQQRKFDIFESVGCMPAFWNDAATYTLGYVPPILVSVVALGYGLLATRA